MPFSALRRFFSSPKYIAFFFIVILAISLITPALTVHAQTLDNTSSLPQNTSSQNDNYLTPNTDPDVPQNQHTYVQSLIIEIMSSATCIVAGVDPTNPQGQCLGVDQSTGKIGYVQNQGGLIGMTGGLIATMYTQPASTTNYVHYLSDNFGITKHAYADDTTSIGSVGLAPLLKIWSAFRNIAYLFFVLGFIIIGFAIMLRLKIDPRTVMTIQNQIPKIIIALLLITFSYAIAGFLVDMMYTTTYLLFNTIGSPAVMSQEGVTHAQNAEKNLIGENPIGFVNDLLGISSFAFRGGVQVGEQVKGLLTPDNGYISLINQDANSPTEKKSGVHTVLGALGGGAAGCALGFLVSVGNPIGCAVGAGVGVVGGAVAPGIGNVVTDAAKGTVTWILTFIAGIAAFLIFAIAILIMLLRVWWILLKAYISILLDIVLAPLWIMGGLFPSSSLTFNTWIRHLIAHLAVFPATIGLFLLARAISDSFSTGGGDMFVPPLIGNPSGTTLSAIIGFGFLMIAPNLLNILRDALKSKPSQYSGAPGQGIMMGVAPLRMGLQRSWRPYNHQTGRGAGWLRALAGGRPAGDSENWSRYQKLFDTLVGGAKVRGGE